MTKNKIWKIKGFEGTFTDEDLITLIREGQVKSDYLLKSKDMKKWIALKESIYQYYMEDKKK
ncbi:MAG: hypothetical protein II004_01885 [Erysipelotrichaceae bacterium]|nr:hypothetical protein [Erysipelotrichaceae bacterium]MBQ1787659.1 hypothetical protein [Erysipelotrichaceae bacterium]